MQIVKKADFKLLFFIYSADSIPTFGDDASWRRTVDLYGFEMAFGKFENEKNNNIESKSYEYTSPSPRCYLFPQLNFLILQI